jgi:hypothetical protein
VSIRTHTQEDPIGLAGGLNLYGFANGDPINFSDPFGLEVRFADDEAEALYQQVRRLAQNASRSRDRNVARAGRGLLEGLDAMESSDKVVVIGTQDANWAQKAIGQDAVTLVWESGDATILIDPYYRSGKSGFSNQIIITHELGHADSSRVDGNITDRRASKAAALRMEDYARTVLGCGARIAHDTRSRKFNPVCPP